MATYVGVSQVQNNALFLVTQAHNVVSAVSNHKYTCDAFCKQFKPRKLCSHTLAAAADNKDLQDFVDVYVSANITLNVTPAATAGGNKYAGRKPGDNPRIRKWSLS